MSIEGLKNNFKIVTLGPFINYVTPSPLFGSCNLWIAPFMSKLIILKWEHLDPLCEIYFVLEPKICGNSCPESGLLTKHNKKLFLVFLVFYKFYPRVPKQPFTLKIEKMQVLLRLIFYWYQNKKCDK